MQDIPAGVDDHSIEDSEAGSGALILQFAVTACLSIVLLVTLLNFTLYSYGRAAVRTALDEGVRAAASVQSLPPEQLCEQKAGEVLNGTLGGSYRDGVQPITCRLAGDRVVASTTAHFPAWNPAVRDYDFHLAASARKEHAP